MSTITLHIIFNQNRAKNTRVRLKNTFLIIFSGTLPTVCPKDPTRLKTLKRFLPILRSLKSVTWFKSYEFSYRGFATLPSPTLRLRGNQRPNIFLDAHKFKKRGAKYVHLGLFETQEDALEQF